VSVERPGLTSSRGQAAAAALEEADGDALALAEAVVEALGDPDADGLADALELSLDEGLGLLDGVGEDVAHAPGTAGDAEALSDADGVGEDDWPGDGVTRKAAISAATRAEVAKRAATFTRPDAEHARG